MVYTYKSIHFAYSILIRDETNYWNNKACLPKMIQYRQYDTVRFNFILVCSAPPPSIVSKLDL